MSTVSGSEPSVASKQGIEDWWDGLNTFQRTTLEYAHDQSGIRAYQDTRITKKGKPFAHQDIDTQSLGKLRHLCFSKALSDVMDTKTVDLVTDDTQFRGIRDHYIEMIAADYRTNEFRSHISRTHISDTEPPPCASTLTVDNYLYNEFGTKRTAPGLTEEMRSIADSFDNTRSMVELASRFSSVEEVREYVGCSPCPSGLSDQDTGLVSLYEWMEKIRTSRGPSRAWDTTKNRTPRDVKSNDGTIHSIYSALKETPRHFPTFGLPLLDQVTVLDNERSRTRTSQGQTLETDIQSARKVGFVDPDPSTSTKAADSSWNSYLPTWLQGSKPATTAPAATSSGSSWYPSWLSGSQKPTSITAQTSSKKPSLPITATSTNTSIEGSSNSDATSSPFSPFTLGDTEAAPSTSTFSRLKKIDSMTKRSDSAESKSVMSSLAKPFSTLSNPLRKLTSHKKVKNPRVRFA